jgi:hypothetical protein
MTGALREDFLEDVIAKFQDRQYPGLAARLVRFPWASAEERPA